VVKMKLNRCLGLRKSENITAVSLKELANAGSCPKYRLTDSLDDAEIPPALEVNGAISLAQRARARAMY